MNISRTYRRTNAAVRFAATVLVASATVIPLTGAAMPAHAASPAVAVEPPALGDTVIMSRLEGFSHFQMPDNGRRLTDAGRVRDLSDRLRSLANEEGFYGFKIGSTEAIAWRSEGDDSSTRVMLESTLMGAGHRYEDLGEKSLGSGISGQAFRARQDGSEGEAVFGFWFVRDGYLTLIWGTNVKPKPAQPTPIGPSDVHPSDASTGTASAPTPIGPSHEYLPDAPSRPSKPSGTGKPIATPSALLGGEWSWTSISRVGYVNQYGQSAAPGGMSARYLFLPGGRYKFFFYTRQQTYGFVSESTTTAEGTVQFYDNGTFLVKPSKGYYRGSSITDRPMTESERKPTLWYWEWRTVSGKKTLYIGPGPSSMSPFKRG